MSRFDPARASTLTFVALAIAAVAFHAPSLAGLIPGGGPPTSDCYVELSVDGIANPSDRVTGGNTVLVTDGESGDQGPCGDFVCAVRMGLCINQHDPNLTACSAPTQLDQLKVKGKINITVPQLLSGSACGAFVSVDVPAKVKRNKAGEIVKAKAGKVKATVIGKGPAGTKPRTDKDVFTIACLPRTVACPGSPSGAFLD